jgi:hypothetical protein
MVLSRLAEQEGASTRKSALVRIAFRHAYDVGTLN